MAILDFCDRTMIQANHPRFSCISDMYLTIYGIIFSGPLMHTDTPSGTGVECIWVEIFVDHKKLLIGTFCRSPSSNGALIATENSIGLANDTNIRDILTTGDFNFDILKPNTWSKINNLCQYFGLKQLIKEPTHYKKLLDSPLICFNIEQ